MDLPANTFKRAINAGRQQIGLWCSIGDPLTCEMLAGCGFDWMLIDTEHTALNPLAVVPILQAVAPYPTHPVVRPSALDPAEFKKLLDAGAQTILVPYIQSVAEAHLAAAAVAYPPDGIRGVAGITRASRFGAVEGYQRRARGEICLILQIETGAALESIEKIAGVPGVDALFIGPADLAASLGYPGEQNHPKVKAACVDGIRRIRAAGKPAGILSLDPEFLAEIVDAGSVFTAVDIDAAILRRGARELAGHWRDRTA